MIVDAFCVTFVKVLVFLEKWVGQVSLVRLDLPDKQVVPGYILVCIIKTM